MADIEKNNITSTDDNTESVDDILAEILNADGSFREEFTGLFAKYIGDEAAISSVPKIDLSDRRDEPGVRDRAVFESSDVHFAREKSVDERIEDKIPEEFREIYSEASSEAQRPEYTSTGNVKYPTMGVGASEQRVVYDADWEEKAKAEAARLERVRQDRMLRGDSTYVRSFVTRSSYSGRKNPFIDDLSDAPSSPASSEGSLYIDPLSKDSDFEGKPDNSQYYNDNKKPFFREGFSVVQKNNVAASGKTEKKSGGKTITSSGNDGLYTGDYRNNTAKNSQQGDNSWLQVDDRSAKKKKKGTYKKKDRKSSKGAPVGKVTERIRVEENNDASADNNSLPAETQKRRVYLYDGKDVETVADETKGLRSTVAEIVDKYNKRNEEDEQRRLEELERIEEEKRIEKQRQEQRRAHIAKLKKNMSPELADAVDDAENEDESFAEYEDFSTEPVKNKFKAAKKKKNTDKALPNANINGENYLEKLSTDDEASQADDGLRKEAAVQNDKASKMSGKKKDGNNKQKVQPMKSNRRKDKK